jgi:hypothetical protein
MSHVDRAGVIAPPPLIYPAVFAVGYALDRCYPVSSPISEDRHHPRAPLRALSPFAAAAGLLIGIIGCLGRKN